MINVVDSKRQFYLITACLITSVIKSHVLQI